MFLSSESLTQVVSRGLGHDRYTITQIHSNREFCQFVEKEKNQIDCLLLQGGSELSDMANWLHGQATLLPAVILVEDDRVEKVNAAFTYHTAEISISIAQLDQIDRYIDQAIAQFINLSPTCRTNSTTSITEVNQDLSTQNFLMLQQRRLTEKLTERLGYLGVYYKRNPQNFFRHLPPDQKQELLDSLKVDYRDIVLCYFANDGTLNQRIDDFVNTVFFTDIAVAQIVEVHMDLMDEFSKQLKLEGRSEEILLDYRLTLIDVIAHLCEMYRRSIPRET